MRTATLHRVEFGEDYVLGRLIVPTIHKFPSKWWTIEQPWRGNAIGMSCLPTGEYTIVDG